MTANKDENEKKMKKEMKKTKQNSPGQNVLPSTSNSSENTSSYSFPSKPVQLCLLWHSFINWFWHLEKNRGLSCEN